MLDPQGSLREGARRGAFAALGHFEVPLEPNAVDALTVALDDHAEVRRWSLRELVPAPHRLGALVVEARGGRFRAWTWEPPTSHLTPRPRRAIADDRHRRDRSPSAEEK